MKTTRLGSLSQTQLIHLNLATLFIIRFSDIFASCPNFMLCVFHIFERGREQLCRNTEIFFSYQAAAVTNLKVVSLCFSAYRDTTSADLKSSQLLSVVTDSPPTPPHNPHTHLTSCFNYIQIMVINAFKWNVLIWLV